MLEIRFHGRGGQGAVTSAELIAIAAVGMGNFAQAFPSFGPERRGAPVVAFCRVDDKKILIRAKIYEPDVVVVLDPGLITLVNPLEGLKEGGILIVNTRKSPDEVLNVCSASCRVATVNADIIAKEELGRVIVNTTMLGAVMKATGFMKVVDIREAVMDRFGPKLGEKNMKALERAFNEVVIKE